MDEVVLRQATPDDNAFIYATMLRSLAHSSPTFEHVNTSAFYKNYAKVVQHILRKPGTETWVACLQSEPECILGYAIHEADVLHFAFVKKAWRGQGIGRQLITLVPVTVCTHITNIGLALAKKHSWDFNPFLI